MKTTHFMGEPDLIDAILSGAERAALRTASRVLFQLRELRNDADDDQTTDFALAAYVCAEVAESHSVKV